MSVTQFFRAPPLPIKGTQQKTHNPAVSDRPSIYHDLGGSGDCGFRAIAAGWLNLFLSGKLKLALSENKNPAIDALLRRHREFFPEQMPTAKLSKEKTVEHMMNTVGGNDLIVSLAYTMRQIAVDTMLNNIPKYRGAFCFNPVEGRDHDVHPLAMSKSSTYIDENAIAALSNALGVQIQVRQHSKSKIMPLLRYNVTENTENKVINIRNQDQHYTAKLDAANVNQLISQPDSPVILPVVQAREEELEQQKQELHIDNEQEYLQKIIECCNEADLKVEANYDDFCTALKDKQSSSGDEFTQELLACYIDSMCQDSYLDGHQRYIDEKFNGDSLFSSLVEQSQAQPLEIPQNLGQFFTKNNSKQSISNDRSSLNEALIHALSRQAAVFGPETIQSNSIRSILEAATLPDQERQAVATP